ncbi:hypothetical protein H5410_000699 [Solanum commersonii]|uniref:Uncharacterized protein n=1 Tax=Solanum commersonii TaxID=4109 RepID=A0A9J6AWT1_SOLCO|nr:hypothetical protein H5410_000699 [Solanum commersonii]
MTEKELEKFKMKSLKTENEVDSNMKRTIRYTFVAPGAIGKGRGRGLKSLDEKGSLPSKSLLPQSSDLVKKDSKIFNCVEKKYLFQQILLSLLVKSPL